MTRQKNKFLYIIVQALASQGDETALGYALRSTYPADQLKVSPLLCGSNPYPCGSLTYRIFYLLMLYEKKHNLSTVFANKIC